MHVSIVDVARNAGVSKSTVSRVLTDDPRVRPETRRRVEESIAALGYRPNALARGLIRGRTHALGLVVFDLANPFFGLLVRGAVQAARARGYTIVICDSAGSVEQQRASMTMFAEQRVDGLLIAPIHTDAEDVAFLRDLKLPAVLVNSTGGNGVVPSIGSDNVHGGYLATDHLLGLGHRRVAFLGDLHTITSCQERLAGYHQAHAERGLPVDARLIVEDLPGLDAIQAAVHDLLDQPDPPTAIFAVNDQYALAALQALAACGRHVPGDMALVGFDDIPVAAWLSVPLTTVAQPQAEQGAQAVAMVIDRIAAPTTPAQQIVLRPQLVIRASCGARSTIRAAL